MTNQKPNVLMTLPTRPAAMARLDAAFTIHALWEHKDPQAYLASVGPQVQAVATTGERGLSADEIAQLPNLEIVACFGVGVDAIDHDACDAGGIPVTNTPDVLSQDVADLAMGLVLAVLRRIVEADRYVRAGRWPSEGMLRLGTRLAGRRLGILGMGRIGFELAKRAAAFDLAVAYHNRRQRSDCAYQYFDSLTGLARWSDILVLTLPGGPSTQNLVDEAVLRALGADGVLINVARGSVVDEAALVAALQNGQIVGAGLDVFAAEPNVPSALFALDQVVLQPHQASATDATRDAMANLVVDNLLAHFAGKPLLTRYVR